MSSPDPTPYPLDHLAQRGVPDAKALIVGDEQLDYRQLEEAVGRTASALLTWSNLSRSNTLHTTSFT